MDLSDWIRCRADFTPEKPALIYEGTAVSYSELAELIDRYAQALGAALGIKPGDRVAYIGLNSPEQLALLFACARIGAILLSLNWRLASPEHTQLLNHARPVVLFAEDEFIDHINSERENYTFIELVKWGKPNEGWRLFSDIEKESFDKPAFKRPESASEDDGLLLCYTSGTTGTPKGAVLSKAALYWNALNSIDMHDMNSEDLVLTTLPMFHVGGLNIQTLPALHLGATVVLMRRFDTDPFFELLTNHPITLTLGVPTIMLAIMADSRWATTRAPELRMIAVGSTVVPPALVTEVCEWGAPLVQVYGATETAPIAAYTPPRDAVRKPASTGKVAAHCEIRIIDRDGHTLGPDEKGEILVRGPNVMTEYWHDTEATTAAFSGKWFHTEDMGHFDEEGFLYVDGRLKDMIISGGENIYPAVIENLLAECEEVEEVAVVGRPDDYWGEVAVAVIVAADGYKIDSEQILQYCQDRIAHFSCPREVVVKNELPRNAMGKVLKEELRALVSTNPGQ